MTKILSALLIFGTLVVHADYLYWMVEVDDNYVKSGTYDAVALMADGSQIDKVSWNAISTCDDAGWPVITELTASDAASYYIELLQGEKVVADSRSYDAVYSLAQLQNMGAIHTGSAMSPALGAATFAIPEPTSGLLFLMGGILLGLKRRRMA